MIFAFLLGSFVSEFFSGWLVLSRAQAFAFLTESVNSTFSRSFFSFLSFLLGRTAYKDFYQRDFFYLKSWTQKAREKPKRKLSELSNWQKHKTFSYFFQPKSFCATNHPFLPKTRFWSNFFQRLPLLVNGSLVQLSQEKATTPRGIMIYSPD